MFVAFTVASGSEGVSKFLKAYVLGWTAAGSLPHYLALTLYFHGDDWCTRLAAPFRL
jgi:hypothetical protein